MTNSGELRAGVDLSFSQPKNLSLKTLMMCNKRLSDAHKSAVKCVLEKMRDMQC